MIKSIITILRTYAACDVERANDKQIIRKQLNPTEVTEDLLKSYASVHGDLLIIPKRYVGTSPQRVESEAIHIPKSLLFPAVYQNNGLSGFDSLPVQNNTGGNDNMYKIMYEREREEAKEYKQKYEETLNNLRSKEIELAEKKPNIVGDLVQGLAGFAPMLMQSGGLGLGSAPANPQPQPAQNMQPVTDKRLASIAGYWSKIDEPTKDNIYNIVAAILTNPSNANTVLSLLNETQTPQD